MGELQRLLGRVLSTSMDKTAVVGVDRVVVHSKYRKLLKRTTKYFAHDEHRLAGVGDVVQLKYMKNKASKKKNWTILEIVKRHAQPAGETWPQATLSGPVLTPPADIVAAASTPAPQPEERS